MRTGMIRHHAVRQIQRQLFDMLTETVAQRAEQDLLIICEAGGFLLCVFIPRRFHIGDGSAALRGQEDTLDPTVIPIHRAAEQPFVLRAAEDFTQGGRAKIQGFAQFPGRDTRIGRGTLQQAADRRREG